MRELYVLDTNVLIYATNKDSIYFEVSQKFILENKHKLCVTLQNISEYVNVFTNKRFLNHSTKDTLFNMSILLDILSWRILDVSEKAYQQLLRLISNNNIHGKHVFDAQLAAVAISNDVNSIVTFNVRDFEMFSDIKIIVPS